MRKGIASLGLLSCLFFLSSCTKALKVESCSPIYAMDTTISITFYNVDNYMEHYKQIKDIYTTYDKYCDDYTSLEGYYSIYDLNQDREGTVSDELRDILKESLKMYQDTNGYFNPFIGKLSHLWKDSINKNQIPEDTKVQEYLNEMKDTSLEISGNKVEIKGNGNLDLGGIAKGYATQKAYEYLESVHVSSYFIDAGNSSIVLGNKNGDDFKVGLSHPFKNTTIGYYLGKNVMISTSSPKYQYIEIDQKKYHHLINPKTGYPTNIYDGIFVLNQNSFEGDAYSTAIFSMDLETAKQFAKEREIQIILYKDDQILFQSEGVDLS